MDRKRIRQVELNPCLKVQSCQSPTSTLIFPHAYRRYPPECGMIGHKIGDIFGISAHLCRRRLSISVPIWLFLEFCMLQLRSRMQLTHHHPLHAERSLDADIMGYGQFTISLDRGSEADSQSACDTKGLIQAFESMPRVEVGVEARMRFRDTSVSFVSSI